MNVTLRQLRVSQSVAQTRNFSRTGETVGLTQPAVSRAIAELERELGLRLLDRTTRDVELTEAGRSLSAAITLAKRASSAPSTARRPPASVSTATRPLSAQRRSVS